MVLYMKNRKSLKWLSAFLACCLLLGAVPALAEESSEAPVPTEEEGILELQQIMEGTTEEVKTEEGMDLEQLTDAYTSETMSEYYNSETGFTMQYQSILVFDEENGTGACTEDRSAWMIIESFMADDQLTMDVIRQAMRLETPDVKETEYPESGSICFDRTEDDGSRRIDIYVKTASWMHHVSLYCTEAGLKALEPFLDYMINSITTDETSIG